MSDKLDARTSDPRLTKVMQGFPPPADKTIRLDGVMTSSSFPNNRWTFSNQRQLKASAVVRRGPSAAHVFPRKLREDLDAIPFTTMEGETLTWGASHDVNFVDGILVLHRGAIVQEDYRGALEPHIPHLAMSVTKSFTGLLAAMLAHEGALDPQALATKYVPELKGTAYGDATCRQVMDMTIGVQYSENYTDPNAEVRQYSFAAGFSTPPADYKGPDSIFGFLQTLKKQGEHGQAFAYKTCNTEVLGWIVQRITGQSIAQLISERIWQKIGAEEDAYVLVDRIGMAMCGAALNLTLSDMARVGEMMRCMGAFNGKQIVPEAVVADIAGGADRDHFAKANYVTLPGWSYRNQWWNSHDKFGSYTARGIHGQVIWVAPKAELVIARFASHPTAANGNGPLDHVSLPSYAALAEHIVKNT
jgi:CubicO group peptidase (beta-lactamase class C family)